jgi:hypothetical protein
MYLRFYTRIDIDISKNPCIAGRLSSFVFISCSSLATNKYIVARLIPGAAEGIADSRTFKERLVPAQGATFFSVFGHPVTCPFGFAVVPVVFVVLAVAVAYRAAGGGALVTSIFVEEATRMGL